MKEHTSKKGVGDDEGLIVREISDEEYREMMDNDEFEEVELDDDYDEEFDEEIESASEKIEKYGEKDPIDKKSAELEKIAKMSHEEGEKYLKDLEAADPDVNILEVVKSIHSMYVKDDEVAQASLNIAIHFVEEHGVSMFPVKNNQLDIMTPPKSFDKLLEEARGRALTSCYDFIANFFNDHASATTDAIAQADALQNPSNDAD